MGALKAQKFCCNKDSEYFTCDIDKKIYSDLHKNIKNYLLYNTQKPTQKDENKDRSSKILSKKEKFLKVYPICKRKFK